MELEGFGRTSCGSRGATDTMSRPTMARGGETLAKFRQLFCGRMGIAKVPALWNIIPG